MEKLYIVIPAYNETDNVEELIHDWYPIVHNIQNSILLVIDDGSIDDTYTKMRKLAESRPQLRVLTKENGGHGDTLLFGYKYAIKQGATWIFQTDSDGQTKADEFSDFWEKRNEWDAVFGYRKVRGDGASRKFVENVLCAMLRGFFGVKVPDANCPFRLMKAEKVGLYINKLPDHYFLPNVMLTVFFAKNDKVLFEEITFHDRKNGSGSIDLKKIIKIGLHSVQDFLVFRRKLFNQFLFDSVPKTD